ncbi:glycosyltransferase family 2 protein [Anaerosporobacter faecicola]|uniref:glycosyltransferase family 2 protein n=1 Tax=Anaerosporobacter faecicola TaxID=2718714 RepID=UPI0014395303|nr:glycosyltransferase [Anaerosporobacter faecicola]
MKKLVSICLLTYMHENYIVDCLNSIINQTYPRLELIIYDDYSTDRTMELIFKTLKNKRNRFEKITILQSKMNTGNICKNVNIMTKYAKGDFVKDFSGDDLMFPDCIENLVLAFEKNSDIGVVCGKPICINDKFKLPQDMSLHKFEEATINIISGQRVFEKLLHKNFINAPSAMIKRELFIKYGYYNEKIGFEDLDMWLKLSHHNISFAFIDCKVVFYRRGESSITNYNSSMGSKKIKYMFMEERKVVKKYLKYVSPSIQKECITNLYRMYIDDARAYNLRFFDMKIFKVFINDKISIKELFCMERK